MIGLVEVEIVNYDQPDNEFNAKTFNGLAKAKQ